MLCKKWNSKVLLGVVASLMLGCALVLGIPAIQPASPAAGDVAQSGVAYAKTITSGSYSTSYFKLTKNKGAYVSKWKVTKVATRTWQVDVDYKNGDGGGSIFIFVSKKAPNSKYNWYYYVGKSKGYKVYLVNPAGGGSIGFKETGTRKAKLTTNSMITMKLK